MAKEKKLTPMMERYLEVKRQNPGTLLFFRMGDFYELFYDDAKIAAKLLGLTLTSRDKNSANPIPMAGFPYHSLDNYLHKLIQAGCRVSVCEQVEDPKQAKGLVKREVTRVVTPGTLTDDELLDPKENNFLACLYPGKKDVGCAWLELSTGRFVTTNLPPDQLFDELARLQPAECLIPEESSNGDAFSLKQLNGTLISERPLWCFNQQDCERRLLEHFGTKSLEGFDLDANKPGVTAAGALLEYVQETQKAALGHILKLEPYRRGTHLLIDEATRRSLELTHTMREGKREGSLISVIDETATSMGARLLSEWLTNPLTAADTIERRLDAVAEFVENVVLCQELQGLLNQTYDLQRLTARIATGRSSPRDLGCLTQTLGLLPKTKAKLAGRSASLIQQLESDLDLCEEVRGKIETALVDEPPTSHTEGGVIRVGFNEELDELRELTKGGKKWIAEYQAAESERTGIPSLKIGFNKVFGYYLEVTAAHKDKVPDDYLRKQTLKNQERYITPELKEYEEKVLSAEERATELEQRLFQELRDAVALECKRLQQTAEVLANVDVLIALAVLAVKQGYCRPEVTTEPVLDIREGRHPVLDRLQPSGEFVPNDVLMGIEHDDKKHGLVQMITGPNMAGKSTYIRQAALITLLAQIGSFVPAKSARIGIADRIFARVGASDELGKGQSTFMVEMTETARILNAATKHSLVILDEIGRGTSTYDGISLAWSVTEYLHDRIGCRTLFATHYHELTELSQTLSQVSNWNVAVQEDEDNIIFLHKIVPGSADKSYGIHVARLAGVPLEVVKRARVILDTLETDHLDETGRPRIPERPTTKTQNQQLSLFGDTSHPVLEELRELDIDHLTPMDALQELNRLRKELTEEG